MSTPSRPPAAPTLWVVVLLLSAGWTALGGSPLLLVVLTACTLAAALARVLPAPLAVLLGPTALVSVHLLTSLFWHDVGVPLRWAHLVLLLAVAVGAGIHLLRGAEGSTARIVRTHRGVIVASLVWPALVTVSLVVVNLVGESRRLGWLMFNDAAMSLLQAREYVDNSPLTESNPTNPVPGTSHVLALFMLPGRADVAPREWVTHDLWRAQQPILLGLAALGILLSLIAAAAVPARQQRARVGAALVAGLLPWTWFVSGYSWYFGFWNAPLAAAAVTVPLAAFLLAPRAPTVASAVIALSAVPVASLWSPLLLVPAALGVALVVTTWRQHLALRGARLVWWLVPPILLGVYVVLVALPSLEHSDALSQEGAILPLHQGTVLSTVALVLAFAVAAWAATGDRLPTVAGASIAVALVAGTQFLLRQRRDIPLDSWGYYPIKYAWLCVIALAGLVVFSVARLAAGGIRGDRRWTLVPLAVALGVSGVALQVLPQDLRPASAHYPTPKGSPDWRLRSVIPVVSLLRPDGISDFDDAVETMERLADPRHTVYFTRYHQVDAGRDLYMNFLLLQMSYLRGDQDFRIWAYQQPGSVATVCDLLGDAREPVEIITSVPGWGEEIRATCPQQEFELTLLPVPPEPPAPTP